MMRSLKSWLTGSRWIDVLLLSALCAFLGAAGGEPYAHPDSVVRRAEHVIASGGHPHFFHYPGLVIYLNAIVYLMASPLDVSHELLGHSITIFFSVVGVICTYLIAYALSGERTVSFIAGLVLSTSLLWITDSHFSTTDIPMASLVAVSVWMTIMITKTSMPLRWKSLALLGAIAGLAAAAKYNGGLVILSIFGAIYLRCGNVRQFIKAASVITVSSAVVFILINPFAVIDVEAFWSDFSFELRHAQRGHHGYSTERAWLFHIGTSAFLAFGSPVLVFSLVGAAWMARTKSIDKSSKRAVAIFPVAYYILAAQSTLAFQRYMIPMLAFVAIYSSLGLFSVYRSVQRHVYLNVLGIKAAVILLAIVAIGPNVQLGLKHNSLLKKDTREDLVKLRRVVLRGKRFVRRGIELKNVTATTDISGFTDRSFPVLVFNSFICDRFIYEPRTATIQLEEYLEHGRVIQISPFTASKWTVPFSPKSLYSPYPPDLQFRAKAGPFFELYFKDRWLAKRVFRAGQRMGIDVKILHSSKGYYYQQFTRPMPLSPAGPSESQRRGHIVKDGKEAQLSLPPIACLLCDGLSLTSSQVST